MLSTLRGTVFLSHIDRHLLSYKVKKREEIRRMPCVHLWIFPFCTQLTNLSVLNGRVGTQQFEMKSIRKYDVTENKGTLNSLPGISHTICFIFYIIFWLLFLKPDILLNYFTFLICKYTVRKGKSFLELFFFPLSDLTEAVILVTCMMIDRFSRCFFFFQTVPERLHSVPLSYFLFSICRVCSVQLP